MPPQPNDSALLQMLHEDVGEMKQALKELAGAVTRLALVEERQINMAAAVERSFGAIATVQQDVKGIDGRVKTLEIAQPMQAKTTEWVDKILWLVVGAFVSGLLSLVLLKPA